MFSEATLSFFFLKKIFFCKYLKHSHKVWGRWCWSWSSDALASWCEELTHWKRPWCWERLKTGGEVGGRGWDVGWHLWLNWYKSDQTLGDSEEQRILTCWSPWGYKELDTSYHVNNNNNICHSFLMWDIPGDRKATSLHLITLLWMKKRVTSNREPGGFEGKLV